MVTVCGSSKIEKDDKSPGEESDISDDDTGKNCFKILVEIKHLCCQVGKIFQDKVFFFKYQLG